MTLAAFLLLMAVIIFAIAVVVPEFGRVSLLAAGLFFLTLYFLLTQAGLHLA